MDVFDMTAQLVLLKVLSVTLFDCRTCHKRDRARQNIKHSDGLDFTEEYSGAHCAPLKLECILKKWSACTNALFVKAH